MTAKKELVLNPDLDGLANQLRKLFFEAKAAQAGGTFKSMPRFRKMELWYAVAEKCQVLHADPYDFIEAAFEYCSVPGGPFPQQLPTRAMDRWFREYLHLKGGNPHNTAGYRLSQAVMTAFNNVQRLATVHRKRVSEILLDENILSLDSCPALIRVLLLPMDPVIAKWAAKARSEIAINPRLQLALKQSKFDTSWL